MASAKVDNEGSFGSKRSRNDSSRNGDWTCSQCGNVNFGFRTVCNRGTCGAARPENTLRLGSVPPSGPFDYPSPVYVGGVPPVPPVMPNGYGTSFSISGVHYGQAGNALGPYGFLSAYPGSMTGFGYGQRPPTDRFGFGFQGAPLLMPGPWSAGGIADNNASRKRRGGPDGQSEGDWTCPKCDNVNFAFRTMCNMKHCRTPRPTSGPDKSDSAIPEGSWTCTKCNNLNYPFRTVCNRMGCGNDKPESGN